MKKFIYIAFVMPFLLLAVSCSKELNVTDESGKDSPMRIYAIVEDAKTELNGTTRINWVAGDLIRVYGYNRNSYGMTSIGTYNDFEAVNIGKESWFEQVTSTSISNCNYVGAIYPSNVVKGATRAATGSTSAPETKLTLAISIPDVQSGSFENAIMVGLPEGSENPDYFHFKTVTSLIKITLPENMDNVQSIQILSGNNITGDMTLTYLYENESYTWSDDNSTGKSQFKYVEIRNSDGSDLTPGRSYYAVVRPSSSNLADNITVSLITSDHRYGSKVGSVASFKLNTIKDLGAIANFEYAERTVGYFKVSESQSVEIALGNLQYRPSGEEWKIALNQYDVIGKDNENISSEYTGWLDLFGYGCTGYGSYSPINYKNDGKYPKGDLDENTDWGKYLTSGERTISGLTGNNWRTLSSAEWVNLFGKNDIGSATVCGIHGIILVPEYFIDPRCNKKQGGSFANNTSGWSTNEYDKYGWIQMELAGAIFLPVTPYRSGGGISVNTTNDNLYYWTSSRPNGNNPQHVRITYSGNATATDAMEYNGYSVRLVKDAPIEVGVSNQRYETGKN